MTKRLRVSPRMAAQLRGDVVDVAECARCGCTDLEACPGGCAWVALADTMADICSACCTPAELVAAGYEVA